MKRLKSNAIEYPLNLLNPNHALRYTLLINVSLSLASILSGAYWDIDYAAYHEQAQHYLKGELDYT